jgi:hypothetical protein
MLVKKLINRFQLVETVTANPSDQTIPLVEDPADPKKISIQQRAMTLASTIW